MRYRRAGRAGTAIVLAAIPLLIVPVWPPRWIGEADVFLLSVASLAAITAIVATATGMFVHHTGLPTLAQAGLWGIGGYASGMAGNELGIGFWPSLALAGAMPAIVALPVAVVSFRTAGMAFLVVTLAFSEFIVLVLVNLEATGGSAGLATAREPSVPDAMAGYYLYCGFLGAALAVCWAVKRSRFGARLDAIRDNEALARSLGLSPFRYRLAAFELSAVIVGIAGALLLDLQRVITPDLFGSLRFIDVYLAVLLGGLAVTAGPALGAWVVAFLPLWLGFDDRNAARLAFGALLVGVMLLARRGLLGGVYPARARRSTRRAAAPTGPRRSPGQRGPRRPLARSSRPAFEVRGLRHSFGANRVLDGVDLSVRAGEVVGVIGPNGSGKTTLLNCASGFLRPSAGSVVLGGERVDGRAADAIARAGLVRTFQRPQALATFTPLASCELIARLASERRHRCGAIDDAQEILTLCGLGAVANVPSSTLTHGEMRLLGVALALIRRPRVLLLDEPAAGLTAADADRLRAVIELAASSTTAVIVVEHAMSFLLPICDRLAVLDGGRKLADGDPPAVCADERVIRAYLGDTYARAQA